MRYTVDAFTAAYVGSKFPDNTWSTDSAEEVGRIIHNCGRKQAGIKLIEVHVNEPHDEAAVEEQVDADECPNCHHRWQGFHRPHHPGCPRKGRSS